MANYLTTDTELTSIANSIRAKSGGSAVPTWESYIAGLSNRAYISDVKGIIEVTYPSGSTCTCSNGTTTLTAPNTSGTVHFGVGLGNWTITSSGGGESANKVLNINKKKLVEEIELAYIDSILNNNSWEKISQIALAGTGDLYWDIGDCKAVALNGTVGTLALNQTLYVFILDFNHPVNKTIADNNIIFGGFKTALTSGVDVCLCDGGYGNQYAGSIKYFNMNHWGATSTYPYNANFGGWAACDLRYDILGATENWPSVYGKTKTGAAYGYDASMTAITSPRADTLMAALPSDMRFALSLWTRWVDNKGNSSNVDTNVTAIVDAGISLLTEFEVFGTRTCANLYEQNHLKLMQYYTAGNSKIKYQHHTTSYPAYWWESSAYWNNAYAFSNVDYSGSSLDYRSSLYSFGLAPAFKV